MEEGEDSKREEYLDYLRLLYERESGKGKQTGITRWALILAIIYVSWNLIDNYSTVRSSPLGIHAIFFLYGLLYLAIVYFKDLVNFRSEPGGSRYNLRVSVNNPLGDIVSSSIWLGLDLGLPILSQVSRDESIYNVAPYEILRKVVDLQAVANIWVLGAIVAVMILVVPIVSISERSSRIPSYLPFLAAYKSNWAKVMWVAVFVELAIGNTVAAYVVISALPAGDLHGILTCSFDLAVIAVALISLIAAQSESNRTRGIELLERDIVFHDLSTEQIRNRIQQEFIGHEIGEWLTIKLDEVRKLAAEVEKLADGVADLELELKKLPPNLLFERHGRIAEYSNKLNAASQKYNDKITPLMNWLNAVRAAPGKGNSAEVASVLEDIFNKLTSIGASTKERAEGALVRLAQVVEAGE